MRYIAVLLFLLSINSYALDVPTLTRPVEDLANVISTDEKTQIENNIRDIYKKNLAQISVLIIPSLEGENLEEYSIKVAEKWKLGSAEHDNGVLLLVAINDRKMRLEVGNGIEGELTDYKSSQIISSMKPYLRRQEYGGAVLEAVNGIKSTMEYYLPEAIEARAEQERLDAIANKKSYDAFMNMMENVGIFVFSLLSLFLFFSGLNGSKVNKLKAKISDVNSNIHKSEEQLKKDIVILNGLKINKDNMAYLSLVDEVDSVEKRKRNLENTLVEMKNYLGVGVWYILQFLLQV